MRCTVCQPTRRNRGATQWRQRSNGQSGIELGNRIGKGAIRSRLSDVYQEILEPKQ
jgi:hypothetical protein